MKNKSDKKIKEMEVSHYKFNNGSVSITYHFMEENPKGKTKKIVFTDSCKYFYSFEKDLLNFQNQKQPPLNNSWKLIKNDILLILPKEYNYTSEGVNHNVISNRTEIEVLVSISFSHIQLSNKKIWHVTIAPDKNSYFTEYDLIKLVSYFGSSQEQSNLKKEIKFKYNNHDSELLSFTLLINKLHNKKIPELVCLDSGIIQLVISEGANPKKFKVDDFFKVIQQQQRPKLNENSIQPFAKAICGIILGIFDFNRMADEEIYDTIQPFMSSNSSFLSLCRGTLLKISNEDDIMDVVKKNVIVSPYLLIPNTVLAHNGYLLSEVKQNINAALDSKSSFEVNKLETIQSEINKKINLQYLSDIFQYPSEGAIIKKGEHQRGIESISLNNKKRLLELSERINTNRSNNTFIFDSVITILLALMTTWSLFKVVLTFLKFEKNIDLTGFIAIIIMAFFAFIFIKNKRIRKN